jgi:hypothetical protein
MPLRAASTRALILLLLLGTSRARAGNDDSILLGNDAALVAGAVTSNSNDGSALWYNPAGLASAAPSSVDVSASAFALRRYKMPGLISAEGGHGGDASFTEIVTIPSAVTYVRRWGGSVVGLGLFASQVQDFTLRASLGLKVAGVLDANVRMLLNEESARYHLAGGWGKKLPRGFSVGAALFGDYYDDAQFAQVSGDYRVTGTPFGVYVSSSYAQEKSLGLHARLGVGYEATPALRFGLSVETPGVSVYHSGRTSGIETQTAPDDQGQQQLATVTQERSYGDAHVGLYAPLRVRFGGSVDVGAATLALDGDVQSRVKDSELGVDRRFVWNLRAGARWQLSETLRLGAGLFTDRGSDRKDAAGAGNVDFYGGTLGGQYEKVRWLASETGKKEGLTFSSTLALRYAVGTGKLGGVRFNAELAEQDRAVRITVNEVTVHLGSGVAF